MFACFAACIAVLNLGFMSGSLSPSFAATVISLESFESCVENGYPANKIVIGMISSEDFSECLSEIRKIREKYSDFYGVFNWEYFDSPPNPDKNPNLWCETIKREC